MLNAFWHQAEKPTEKSFRPSHRASLHGSILHDASYFATLELSGNQQTLKAVLGKCCDPQGDNPVAARSVTRLSAPYVLDVNSGSPDSLQEGESATLTSMHQMHTRISSSLP